MKIAIKKPVKGCKECGNTEIVTMSRCRECYNKYQHDYRMKNLEKARERERNYYHSGKEMKCKECGKKFLRIKNVQFCSRECQSKNWKEAKIRKGKNNPAYRSGLYENGKYSGSKGGRHHLYQCSLYRKKFLEENDYVYCECCGVSTSPRFEVHHIVFASEAPKHPELHNHKNLIMVCIKCHNKFHSSKKNRNDIVKERGLNDLFNRNLHIYDKN